jgi:regulator of nucleoside diphosphate kinase
VNNVKTSILREQEAALPQIKITIDEKSRLSMLADSSLGLFPHVAHFLASEMERADVVAENADLRGVVRMGSRVSYRDETKGDTREVVLVYPHEANIDLNRISVLTPVGAALIGLSVGQSIAFETPARQLRSLTVLGVSK